MNKQGTILITGDLVPLHQAGELLSAGDFQMVFGNFLPEIRNSDLAVTNLETAVTDGGEPITKFGPNLKVSPLIMPALTKAGFHVYALANNHSRDWGDKTFLETMRHVSKPNENRGFKTTQYKWRSRVITVGEKKWYRTNYVMGLYDNVKCPHGGMRHHNSGNFLAMDAHVKNRKSSQIPCVNTTCKYPATISNWRYDPFWGFLSYIEDWK